MDSSGQANQTLTHYPAKPGKGATPMMPSDAIGLIVGFGFWLAVMNAYILSLAPANHTQQEFQLQIELDIRGGVK